VDLNQFLSEVSNIYSTGAATEHSYRSALQNLLSSIGDNVTALNEPKRVKCGAPDFIVSEGDIVIGHVEAKDTLAAVAEEAFEARKAQLKGDGKAGRWFSPLELHVLPKLGRVPV
jgi:hypothetical protein